METFVTTRQELYDKVWSESLTAIAKQLDVPYHKLVKACKDNDIPTPAFGYWQKLKFGKASAKLPLPASDSDSIEIKQQTLPSAKVIKTEAVIKQEECITVPDRLTNPDRLIVAAKKEFEERQSYKGLIMAGRGQLSITVTKAHISRALRLFDSLIKTIRDRGGNVVVDGNTTYAVIKTKKIEISLREKQKRVEVNPNAKYSWDKYELVPTGLLAFKHGQMAYYSKDVSDGKRQLEELLPTVILKLEEESDRIAIQEEESRKWREEYDRKRKIEEEISARKKKELDDVKELISQATRHHQSVLIRQYIESVRTNAIENGGLSEEQSEWIQWATKTADSLDPAISNKDGVLVETEARINTTFN